MSDTICPPSADTPPVEDARAQDRRPARAAITLALVCGAQFMFILDLAIVNLAVPSIQEDLGLSPSQPQWVVVVYGLTFGGFLLLGGRTADLVGRRTVLVAGLGVFTLASLSAGLAGSFGTLVASRAVQGVGAAFAAPAALSILTSTFPEGALRNRALGVYGAVGAAAASVGLVLGGALTTGPGWPWVFLMNVPIGVGLIGLALAHLPSAPPDGHGTADVPGAAAVTAGLLALVYAINESVERGWTSRTTIGFAALGTVFLVVFAVVERRAPSPIVQRSVYRQRTLVVAMGVAALVFASFLGFNLQLTLFMQQVLGYSAIEAGLAWLATSTLAVVMGVAVAARLIGRVGAGRTLLAGQLSAAGGLLWLSRLQVDATYATDLLPGLLLLGVGIGLSGIAAQVAAFVGVDRSVAGVAGGLVESCREIGGALGTAIIATVVLGVADSGGDAGSPEAFTAGVRRGALVALGISVVAALVGGTLLRHAERRAAAAERDAPLEVAPG